MSVGFLVCLLICLLVCLFGWFVFGLFVLVVVCLVCFVGVFRAFLCMCVCVFQLIYFFLIDEI